jgi:hypothetical protein
MAGYVVRPTVMIRALAAGLAPVVAALVVIVRRSVTASVIRAIIVLAMVGMLMPTIVDVARPRTVATIRLMPNLGLVRVEIAGRVVVVPGVNVPARLHEGIAVPR